MKDVLPQIIREIFKIEISKKFNLDLLSFELGNFRFVSECVILSATELADVGSDYQEYKVKAETSWSTSGHKRVVKRTNQSLFLPI